MLIIKDKDASKRLHLSTATDNPHQSTQYTRDKNNMLDKKIVPGTLLIYFLRGGGWEVGGGGGLPKM